VLVVVVAVGGVAVLSVDVIDMVAVLDGLVSAVGAVLVLVDLGGDVSLDPVLVVVALVLVMDMPVVDVVDVAVVLERDVSAVRGVLVRVLGVDVVRDGHGVLLAGLAITSIY